MQYEHNELMEVTKEYIKILKDSGLGYLRLKNDKFEIELGEKPAAPPVPQFPPMGMPGACPPPHTQQAAVPAPSTECAPVGDVVTSPIVGTFYAAPSPEKPPYVTVGKQVHKGDVLFIIESMKLMNEVTSEFDGTVAEIMVEDGETVEFGQPIIRIE